MVSPLNSLKPAAVMLAVPVVLLSACAPNEPVATQPGTVPPVWTGSPAPAAMAEGHSSMGPSSMGPGSMGPGSMPRAAVAAETLTAQINSADGTQVAAATIEFTDDDAFATITVQTVAPGLLSPGMHGMHIHAVGKCEVN